ncbi:MAG: extracellular solute-binding protein, partial [Rubrobacter sp.]|nr:extracellular solute-binding protein [Rubrobacter sp.]
MWRERGRAGRGRQVLYRHRGDDRAGEVEHRDPGRQVPRTVPEIHAGARGHTAGRCPHGHKTRLQSDQPPDAFSYDTGPGFGGVLADAGLLLPLEDAYKKNGWKTYDWAKQRATYNGTVYGVPDQVEEIIVYYNKNLIPEEPKTVDELRQIADDLKEQGKTPFAFGDQEQWPAGHIFSIGISNMLGREGLDNILYGDGRWDVPEVEEAVNLLFRNFVDSGYYPDGVNALTYDDTNALFFAGDAGMLPTGTWLVSTIVESVRDFEVGFFPFPSIDGSGIAPPAGVGTG